MTSCYADLLCHQATTYSAFIVSMLYTSLIEKAFNDIFHCLYYAYHAIFLIIIRRIKPVLNPTLTLTLTLVLRAKHNTNSERYHYA